MSRVRKIAVCGGSTALFREVEAEGVLLSHARYDHCGYISYLREDVPIFTGFTSALICKALQDTGGGNEASGN